MRSYNKKLYAVNLLLAVVIDAILLMAFISLALVAYSGAVEIVVYVRFLLIWLVILLVSLVIFQVPRILVQYGQIFYKLPQDQTLKFLTRLVIGLSQYPPQKPVLKVQDGKIVSEASGVLEQVGGPGFLSIEHNNAVVTHNQGKLSRILGPGFYTLEAFEKVWDIVDLRPQRRTINVHFMTQEGIPAYVDAEIVFRIPFIDEYIHMGQHARSSAETPAVDTETYPTPTQSFSADAVLKVTTEKTISSPQAGSVITDWIAYVPDEILDNTVRDILECYSLDDFIYPQYWLSLKEHTNHDGQTEYKVVKPHPLVNYKTQIETKVKDLAQVRGVFVEYVELGPVLPVETAISREWLEFWQAKLHNVVYQHSLKVNVDSVQNGERAAVGMLVDLIANTVQKMQRLTDNELRVPPELTVLSFLDVVQSMSEYDPGIQQLVNRNADKFASIIDAIQRPDPLVEDIQNAPLY